MANFNISSPETGDRHIDEENAYNFGTITESGSLDGTVYMSWDCRLENSGVISSFFNGVELGPDTDDSFINNYATGTIEGFAAGIFGDFPAGVEIFNYGGIKGDFGISLSYRTGDWRLQNFGSIEGATTGIAIESSEVGAAVTLYNEGTIKGDSGVTSQATLHLDNFGTIESVIGLDGILWTIVAFDNDDAVGNSGTIIGRVDLSHGNNLFSGLDGLQEWVQTGNGTDIITGGIQGEVLISKGGKDAITGNGGNDSIWGGAGNDTLAGDSGNDRLQGDQGVDLIVGGDGKDLFYFRPGDGKDTISDFTATGKKHDVLDLRMVIAIKSFEDFIDNHAKQSGDHVIVTGNTGDSILLLNTDIDDFDKGDILL